LDIGTRESCDSSLTSIFIHARATGYFQNGKQAMSILESTDLVEYSTASHLAATYGEQIVRVREALATLSDVITTLEKAFKCEEGRSFTIQVSNGHYRSHGYDVTSKDLPGVIEDEMHKTAWRVLVNKLGVRRMMSSKRASQLDELLDKGFVINEAGQRETLPEINQDTIMGVLGSFVDSASSFLDEAITEEYDYWKPPRSSHVWKATEYKTNAKHTFKLEPKLIKTYAFRTWKFGGKSEISGLTDETQRHLTALDNIMHMLDGKGQISGYCGPLVDAINASKRGGSKTAKTDYFYAKWYLNGNMHLEFLRSDLLSKFNEICGRNRLADDAA
jgi:hypothetical protein